jgi:hypothetical protein
MGGNMSDRVGTTVASLELVLKHPFGMGSTYEAPMDQLTGYDATHNALTQLALMAGLPLAVLITVMLLDTARKVFLGRHRIQYWVAVYVLGVSMFESAFFIPFFSVITLWLIAQPTACAAGSEQSGLHSLDAERSSRIPAHEVILR